MPETAPLVIAIVTDDDRAAPAIARATRLGLERQARVVLYDVSATGSIFENPLPTEWSSQDLDREHPADAHAGPAGHGRASGARAKGSRRHGGRHRGVRRLPDRGDAASLAEYADAQGRDDHHRP